MSKRRRETPLGDPVGEAPSGVVGGASVLLRLDTIIMPPSSWLHISRNA
jgi:hypothetical protein